MRRMSSISALKDRRRRAFRFSLTILRDFRSFVLLTARSNAQNYRRTARRVTLDHFNYLFSGSFQLSRIDASICRACSISNFIIALIARCSAKLWNGAASPRNRNRTSRLPNKAAKLHSAGAMKSQQCHIDRLCARV